MGFVAMQFGKVGKILTLERKVIRDAEQILFKCPACNSDTSSFFGNGKLAKGENTTNQERRKGKSNCINHKGIWGLGAVKLFPAI